MQSLSIYFLKSLPLNYWCPTPDDYEIIAVWLVDYNIDSFENIAAKTIISNLNWGLDGNDCLFIAHENQFRMACLILQALIKHTDASKFYKQDSLMRYINWSWDAVGKLRLHLIDQGQTILQKTILNPFEMLVCIPELDRVDIINAGKY